MDRCITEHATHCPFCAAPITLLLDASAGSQQYIEDCEVCCRPLQITLRADNGELDSVEVDCAS